MYCNVINVSYDDQFSILKIARHSKKSKYYYQNNVYVNTVLRFIFYENFNILELLIKEWKKPY